MKKIRVKKGLHSFVYEIARFSMTSGFHYAVTEGEKRIEITHHGGRWRVIVEPHVITVRTDDNDVLILKKNMVLNGEEIEEICDTIRCYTAREIVEKILLAIVLYYSYRVELKWLYRWISG